jgi:hypothetical protein
MIRLISALSAGSMSVAAVAGSTVSGFDAFATTAERVDLKGVPLWMSGRFRIGDDGTVATVQRRALGRTEIDGSDDQALTRTERFGRMSFAATGPGVGGSLSGDCRYDRSEESLRMGSLSVARPLSPLLFQCRFEREGRQIGTLRMFAAPRSRALVQFEERRGEVRTDATTLAIHSLHKLGARQVTTSDRVGYAMAAGDRVVAMIDLNGFTRRRLALPYDPQQREAALAASLALALFWDPGDTDE